MKSIMLMAVLVLVLVTVAYGQLYEWTDDSGSVNFSDNPDHIPAKYRSRAKLREGTTADTTVKEDGKKDDTPLRPEPVSRSNPGLYDGQPLSWWQSAYADRKGQLATLHADLDKLKDEQAVARRRRVTYQRTMDRMALNAKTEEVAAMEARIKELEKGLAEFKSRAEGAGLTVDMLESGSR